MMNRDISCTVSEAEAEFSLRMLCGVDDFGRKIIPMGEIKSDKPRYVGLFYFLWLGMHPAEQKAVYEINRLEKENPAALWAADDPKSPRGAYHFWGKPLFGYYNSADPWVLRKHAELLTAAGIDFLVFDATNAYTYPETVSVLLSVFDEYRRKGWNVPKFMFYTNCSCASTVRRLYDGSGEKQGSPFPDGIYKSGLYRELWFAPEGKPLIAAITDGNGGASDQGTAQAVRDKELLDFFDIKESQWPNVAAENPNGFPWIDFTRPQRLFGNAVNVSVAQHNKLPFSDARCNTRIENEMWGRGYTSANGPDHGTQAVHSGKNFEEQWQTAFEKDARYTFVTGWNEWIALKQHGRIDTNGLGPRTFFVDAFNTEFSRDIEPMSGGYGDNFYLQLVRNVRKFKREQARPAPSPRHTADLGDERSLTGIPTVYKNITVGAHARDHVGFCPAVRYTQPAPPFSVEEVRVASDDKNLVFLIKTAGNAALASVVLAAENAPCGFVLNRGGAAGACTVESVGGGEYKPVCTAQSALVGNALAISVPLAALGLKPPFAIAFKVVGAEGTEPSAFYTQGTCAPAGRLGWVYSAQ